MSRLTRRIVPERSGGATLAGASPRSPEARTGRRKPRSRFSSASQASARARHLSARRSWNRADRARAPRPAVDCPPRPAGGRTHRAAPQLLGRGEPAVLGSGVGAGHVSYSASSPDFARSSPRRSRNSSSERGPPSCPPSMKGARRAARGSPSPRSRHASPYPLRVMPLVYYVPLLMVVDRHTSCLPEPEDSTSDPLRPKFVEWPSYEVGRIRPRARTTPVQMAKPRKVAASTYHHRPHQTMSSPAVAPNWACRSRRNVCIPWRLGHHNCRGYTRSGNRSRCLLRPSRPCNLHY